jgi:surface antigen
MRSTIIVLVVLSLFGAACETKQGQGTAIGGAAGGALGYAVGGVPGLIIGGLSGGAAGSIIGRKMDDEDRARAAAAIERNREVQWQNPQTGARYDVQPTQTSYREGRECRDFQMTSYVDGKPDEVNGTACRRPDGKWEMANDQG